MTANSTIKLPAQFLPSPVNPTRQLQVYDPSVLLHSALVPQLPDSGLAHSSISVSKDKGRITAG